MLKPRGLGETAGQLRHFGLQVQHSSSSTKRPAAHAPHETRHNRSFQPHAPTPVASPIACLQGRCRMVGLAHNLTPSRQTEPSPNSHQLPIHTLVRHWAFLSVPGRLSPHPKPGNGCQRALAGPGGGGGGDSAGPRRPTTPAPPPPVGSAGFESPAYKSVVGCITIRPLLVLTGTALPTACCRVCHRDNPNCVFLSACLLARLIV